MALNVVAVSRGNEVGDSKLSPIAKVMRESEVRTFELFRLTTADQDTFTLSRFTYGSNLYVVSRLRVVIRNCILLILVFMLFCYLCAFTLASNSWRYFECVSQTFFSAYGNHGNEQRTSFHN